jgi:hypothetical protein
LFWVYVVGFLFMAIIDSQTIKGFYFILASSRKRLPFIVKSLFTNDTIVENWKENINQDMWFMSNLNVNHALLNNNMHKRILRFSKTLVWYLAIVGWETCDLWLTYNWFNQFIKYLCNINFETKVNFWTCLNYIKK